MKTSPSRFVVLLALTAACSPPAARLTEAERATIAASVDSAMESFEAAERARDAEGTIAHLAPDFYMYNDGARLGYDDVAASIRSTMSTFRHFEPEWTNVAVRVLGRDAALVSFTFRDSIVTTAGEILRGTGPTTLVWERRDADWLIVYADADHYPVP